MSTPRSRPRAPGSARLLLALATLGVWLLSASAASAGTLCGAVRDSLTQAPVARAGIFLRTTAGAYTGLHAATGADGRFCLDGIAPGAYDVEVRVDGYRVGYRRVVIHGDATGLEFPVLAPALRLAPPAPNPARGPVRLSLELREPASVRLLVLDAAGRLVRGWASDLAAGPFTMDWDLRTEDGARVPRGIYFVHLVTDSGEAARRLVVL